MSRNINDLIEEKSDSKVIEETIRYKNLEWSFSCSESDMKGHRDKHEGIKPHYHFQMKVDGNVIINYSGFHIPFHDSDFFYFAMKNSAFDRLKHAHIQGAGMQAIFDRLKPEEILDRMTVTDDEDKAQFKLDTLITADDGKTISGDEIAAIVQESKRTGIPISKLVTKLKNVKIQTVITPGPSIPEISKRTKR